MFLSRQQRLAKLRILAAVEGFPTVHDLIAAVVHDSVSPGICVRQGCDYTCQVEPDQDMGWCEECRTQTVQSVLVLPGLI